MEKDDAKKVIEDSKKLKKKTTKKVKDLNETDLNGLIFV